LLVGELNLACSVTPSLITSTESRAKLKENTDEEVSSTVNELLNRYNTSNSFRPEPVMFTTNIDLTLARVGAIVNAKTKFDELLGTVILEGHTLFVDNTPPKFIATFI
jgi:chorismate mutase